MKPPSRSEADAIPGTSLFRSNEASDTNAYLGTAAGDWNAYAKAFQLAANTLFAHLTDSRMHLDLLAFPITFLYRHYLELRLKELTQVTCGLSKADLRTHDLLRLWQRVRPELHTRFPGAIADLDLAEQTIKSFATVDDGSFVFRYPVNKAGQSMLPSQPKGVTVDANGVPVPLPPQRGLKQIDMTTLRDEMAALAQVLNGASIAFHEDNDSS